MKCKSLSKKTRFLYMLALLGIITLLGIIFLSNKNDCKWCDNEETECHVNDDGKTECSIINKEENEGE